MAFNQLQDTHFLRFILIQHPMGSVSTISISFM